MFGLFKKTKADTGPRLIHIQPLGQSLEHSNGDNILSTALEAGINFPHNCRVGGCASCKCKLLEGEVQELTDKSYLLSEQEMADNYILACQSIPKSNIKIEVAGLSQEVSAKQLIKTKARITDLKVLTHDIIELQLSCDEALDYLAGQYADLKLPNELGLGSRSYSFAQAPAKREDDKTLSFHVRKVPNGLFTEWLHAADRSGTELEISGPYGDFYLRPDNAPILAIAGGSGMAPLKALLEQMQAEGCAREVLYLFGARSQQDLYCLEEMQALAEHSAAKFEFLPILSEEAEGSNWQGLRGFVTEHIETLLGDNVAQQHVYMCGPPPMIDASEALLAKSGVDNSHIHYDKFLDSSHSP